MACRADDAAAAIEVAHVLMGAATAKADILGEHYCLRLWAAREFERGRRGKSAARLPVSLSKALWRARWKLFHFNVPHRCRIDPTGKFSDAVDA